MSYCPHCPRHCLSPEDCHAEDEAGPTAAQVANEQRAEFYRREILNDLSRFIQANPRELYPF